MEIDDRARALLDALNELFAVDWMVTPAGAFYDYRLLMHIPGRNEPFDYHRAIRPEHINGQPFRTALQFADEACERFGRYWLLKPDDSDN